MTTETKLKVNKGNNDSLGTNYFRIGKMDKWCIPVKPEPEKH